MSDDSVFKIKTFAFHPFCISNYIFFLSVLFYPNSSLPSVFIILFRPFLSLSLFRYYARHVWIMGSLHEPGFTTDRFIFGDLISLKKGKIFLHPKIVHSLLLMLLQRSFFRCFLCLSLSLCYSVSQYLFLAFSSFTSNYSLCHVVCYQESLFIRQLDPRHSPFSKVISLFKFFSQWFILHLPLFWYFSF